MAFVRYGWAAARITREDMAGLYRLKQGTGRRITGMVQEAVAEYLERQAESVHNTRTEGAESDERGQAGDNRCR